MSETTTHEVLLQRRFNARIKLPDQRVVRIDAASPEAARAEAERRHPGFRALHAEPVG